MKLLNSLVGEFLKNLQGASTEHGDSKLEVEGDSSKEESPVDFAHTKVNDERDMGFAIAS